MASTTEPRRSPSSRPSRRALLGAAALAPAAALPARAAAVPVGPDPHPAWYREWEILLEWCDTADLGGRELAECTEYHRSHELERLIGTTPAGTVAGALAQLRVLDYYHGESLCLSEGDAAGLANALATLERLAELAAAVEPEPDA